LNPTETIHDLRNRLIAGGHSKAGTEIWRGSPFRGGIESAFESVAGSSQAATANKTASSRMGLVQVSRLGPEGSLKGENRNSGYLCQTRTSKGIGRGFITGTKKPGGPGFGQDQILSSLPSINPDESSGKEGGLAERFFEREGSMTGRMCAGRSRLRVASESDETHRGFE
jgi:hypothetical protein